MQVPNDTPSPSGSPQAADTHSTTVQNYPPLPDPNLKGDVQGSVETLRVVLGKIGSDEVKVSVKHSAVGGINESDVTLAEATGSIVIGFNVTTTSKARQLAESKGVDIRLYDVIYDITDDVEKAASGLLDPELKLEVLGHAEVKEVFKVSKVGAIAGCYVTDGVVERNAQIRVTRDGIVVERWHCLLHRMPGAELFGL